jgi:hypothetical protein
LNADILSGRRILPMFDDAFKRSLAATALVD